MALRVWLPLNGTLENKGVSNVTVTNNNVTIDNNGKIGKCYKHLNCSITNLQNMQIYPMTIAFWMKSSDTTSQWQKIITFDNANLSQIHGIYIADSARIKYEYNPSLNITKASPGEWHHYAFVINNGQSYGYYDGVLSATSSETVTLDTLGKIRIGEGTNIYLNDIRIYDHCLSPKEVKEISQGLVLHYKLDGWSGGAGENLYHGTKDFSGSWDNSSTWTTSSEKYDNFTVKEKSSVWGGLAQKISCVQNDIFTISFYAKVEAGGSLLSVHRSNLGNVTTGLQILNGNFSGGSTNSGTWVATNQNGTSWKRYWATVKIIQNDITYLQWRIENSVANKKLSVAGFKLERGDKATNWCPSISEIGIDITKITDSSGYGNDGIINGNLITDNNTSKYSSSTFFDGNTAAIKIPFNDIIKDKNYTVSCWTYKTTIGTKNYQTILGGPSGFELEARSGSNTSPLYRIYNWGGGTTPYEFNKWNHFCFVHTDADSKLYVNGELKITGTSANIPTGNYFIGSWSTATSQNYEGQMSDFRLYTTALSAEDILDLYHTPANIDNLGGIHGFEFIEKTPNLLNPDLREWSKESNVTCVWNEETKYFDVNTNRDTSNTSRWGIFQNITVKPNTSYLFAVDMMGTGSAMGVAAQDTTTAWPSDRNTAGDTKRYYYILTTTATNTVGRVYLDIKPSINQIAHFKNIYLGEIGEIASIKQSGIFENEDMVEYNENGRITKSGELAGSNFIEK